MSGIELFTIGATAAGSAATAGTAAAAAGTAITLGDVLGVLGALTSFGSSLAASNRQASMASFNAEQAMRQREFALARGRTEAAMIRRRNRQILSEGRARLGTSGVTAEGSPLLVQADNAREGELDALTALHAGTLEGVRLAGEAAISRSEARRLRGGRFVNAGARLLTAAAPLL